MTVAYVVLMCLRSAFGVTLVNPVMALLKDAMYMSSILSVMRSLLEFGIEMAEDLGGLSCTFC